MRYGRQLALNSLIGLGMLQMHECWGQSTDPAPATPPAYAPLSAEERLALYTKETFRSPKTFFASVSAAASDQLGHEPSEWRQGAGGYSRRVVSNLARFVIQDTIQHGTAAALGLDTRYIPCTCHGLWRRTGHALKMSLFAYDRSGRQRPDLAYLAGAYGSGMLSMYWYPQRYRPLVEGVRAGNVQVGVHVGTQIVSEFTPELKRIFHLK